MRLTNEQKTAIRDACIKAQALGWTLKPRVTLDYHARCCCLIGACIVMGTDIAEMYDPVFTGLIHGFDQRQQQGADPDAYKFGAALRKEFINE